MRSYEAVFSFSVDNSEESLNAFCDRLNEVVKKEGGEVISLEPWGRRKVDQVLQGQRELYYYCMTFSGTGELISKLENHFKISPQFISHIVIRLKNKEVKSRKFKEGEEDGGSSDVRAE